MRDTKHRDRLAKLLRLAKNNPNRHEAATAYAHAVAYAARHALRLDDAEDGDNEREGPRIVENIEDRLIFKGSRIPHWRLSLATSIANANRCDVYRSRVRGGVIEGLRIFGQPSDMDAVQYLYTAICAEVAERGRLYGKGRGRGAASDFRNGMAHEIGERIEQNAATMLAESKEQAYSRGGETALARVCEALAHVEEVSRAVETYAGELGLKPYNTKYRVGGDYERGRAAGAAVNIGGNKAIG